MNRPVGPAEDFVQTAPTSLPGVWELVLARPPVNAFDRALYRSMTAALDALAADPETTCVLIRSAIPGAFSAGADARELASLTEAPDTDGAWAERESLTRKFLDRVRSFPVPLIAVVDGYAVGAGFVLASLCDIRIATPVSWFSIPELALSRAGGARHGLRVLPQGIVRTMYFARARLSAERACALGFVHELVDGPQVLQVAYALAGDIADTPAGALRDAKAALQQGEELPVDDGVHLERLYSQRMASRPIGEPPC